jgi:hypothetical protein
MNPEDIVRDFATRTKANLRVIEALESAGLEVYEVTQLVNSLLGLLVFPQQRYFRRIPETPLETLAQDGWPKPLVEGDFPSVKTLKDLMRYLRNAIAHFNVEYISDDSNQIQGMRVWNMRRGEENWSVELSLGEIRLAVDKFLELMIPDSGYQDRLL